MKPKLILLDVVTRKFRDKFPKCINAIKLLTKLYIRNYYYRTLANYGFYKIQSKILTSTSPLYLVGVLQKCHQVLLWHFCGMSMNPNLAPTCGNGMQHELCWLLPASAGVWDGREEVGGSCSRAGAWHSWEWLGTGRQDLCLAVMPDPSLHPLVARKNLWPPVCSDLGQLQRWQRFELTYWGCYSITPRKGESFLFPAIVQQQPCSLCWILQRLSHHTL